MFIDKISKEEKKEILEVARSIYDFAEIGSKEEKSSYLLAEKLSDHGFKIDMPFQSMKTAFRATFGSGKPTVGLLAEYDALPNGHSCGHNLISAWAFGTALLLSRNLKNGKIVVFGTPSEEGIGEYSGSKVTFSDNGVFSDVDFVIGMHPSDEWAAGSTSFCDISYLLKFHGRSTHAANSPESGINALDAAVSAYVNINLMRDSIKVDKFPVIGMVFREGGTATNVVPDIASIEVDLRSKSHVFIETMVKRMKRIAKASADAFGAQVEIQATSPLYLSYKNIKSINEIILDALNEMGIKTRMVPPDEIPSGSTDEGNVSRVVPTGHIDIKITEPGTPGHSDEFRIAANPDRAGKNLINGIIASANACLKIMNEESVLKEIKRQFLYQTC